MITQLKNAYLTPKSKFFYFTANGNPEAKRIIGRKYRDWTPQKTVNIEPYYWNTHTLALAFGCEKMFTSEGKEWIKPRTNSLHDIIKSPLPDIRQGRTGEILNLIEILLDENQEDHLVRLPDIQSPLGVAELILGENLYINLMTDPVAIHDLLKKITEFIIIYVQEIKSVSGPRLNAACHPQIWCDSEGYYISDDANSMVSPEMHEEFSVDYINRVTDELGPVIYHTCTWTEPYLKNIRKIKDKKLINWSIGTSMDPAEILKENSGKVIIAPHIGAGTHHEESLINAGLDFEDEADLVKYFLDNMQDDTNIYMSFEQSLFTKPEVFRKIYHLIEQRGYVPKAES